MNDISAPIRVGAVVPVPIVKGSKSGATHDVVICQVNDDGSFFATWGDNNRQRFTPDQIEVSQ